MSKLFESSWRDGYTYFERYFDTDLNKSVKKEISIPCEWYEPSSKGLYTYILDETLKLERKQGRAKDGREHYGFIDPMYRNIRDNYWNKDSYNMSPRVWFLDIETRSGQNSNGFPVPEKALEEISMIQIYDSKINAVIMLGLRDWKHQDSYEFECPVKYFKLNTEIELIETYLTLFKKMDPLIIYAWNGLGFDFPYLYNRFNKLGIDINRLSNHGNVNYSENRESGKLEFMFNSNGHFYIDLLHVYKKFVFEPRSSYSLDNISEIELGERKVQHPEYAGFDDFYTGKYIIPINPTEEQLASRIYQHAIIHGVDDEVRELAHSEFCYYSYKDPLLIKKIDDKLNFTVLMCMIAEKMGVQISDTLGTVKPWSQYILNKSMLDMKVMPKRKEHDSPNVVGGYVKDPIKGKHKWVLSADVNSMYPMLSMSGFNMSPETYVQVHKLPDELKEIVLRYFNDQDESKVLNMPKEILQKTTILLNKHNLSLAINGAVFSKDTIGIIPELVQDIYSSRKKAKKVMFNYEKRKLLIKQILKAKQ